MKTISGQPQRLQFSLWHLLVVISICAVVLWLARHASWWGVAATYLVACSGIVIWGIQSRREAISAMGYALLAAGLLGACLMPDPGILGRGPSNRTHCRNQLIVISYALQNYHDVHGRFPPAFIADKNGRPMHSWRVLILPYLEHNVLYQQYRFDEPWDGPNNRKLHKAIVSCYVCPAHHESQPRTETNYLVVQGPETMWPGARCTSRADLRDGADATLMVVEVHGSGVHWMEPRDLHVSQMPMLINPRRGTGISSPHHDCAQGAMADGAVKTLPSDLAPRQLRALLTIDCGEPQVLLD